MALQRWTPEIVSKLKILNQSNVLLGNKLKDLNLENILVPKGKLLKVALLIWESLEEPMIDKQ